MCRHAREELNVPRSNGWVELGPAGTTIGTHLVGEVLVVRDVVIILRPDNSPDRDLFTVATIERARRGWRGWARRQGGGQRWAESAPECDGGSWELETAAPPGHHAPALQLASAASRNQHLHESPRASQPTERPSGLQTRRREKGKREGRTRSTLVNIIISDGGTGRRQSTSSELRYPLPEPSGSCANCSCVRRGHTPTDPMRPTGSSHSNPNKTSFVLLEGGFQHRPRSQQRDAMRVGQATFPDTPGH